jgi:catalase
VHSNHRDGQGRVDGNYGALPHYEPNSFGQWQGQPQFSEPPLKLTGNAAHWSYDKDDHNYFEQPGKLFRLMNDGQKEALLATPAEPWATLQSSSSSVTSAIATPQTLHTVQA